MCKLNTFTHIIELAHAHIRSCRMEQIISNRILTKENFLTFSTLDGLKGLGRSKVRHYFSSENRGLYFVALSCYKVTKYMAKHQKYSYMIGILIFH